MHAVPDIDTSTAMVDSSTEEESCPRGTSRKVRNYLGKNVFPVLRVNPDDLPSQCPFHSSLDLYKIHEDNKKYSPSSEHWEVC